MSAENAFTLIELLVVIVIIAVLAAIAVPVLQSVAAKGQMIKEVQAGRSLITAFVAAAADRDGQYPGGYDRSVTQVVLPTGTTLGSPISNRYPFRLAPYLNNRLDGTILVNGNAKTIKASDTYMVSCYPAFGMNYIFVGGDVSANGTINYQADCISRAGSAETSPLVFASAAGDGEGSKISGYCILTPPQTTGSMWSSTPWKRTSAAADYGNVDARYTSKAVCVFLDGSIREIGIEDLRDMRLWSKNAAAQGNAKYVIKNTPTGGR